MASFFCPTCREAFTTEQREDAPYRPFCSQRCQMLDLYHWLQGDYRISDPLSADPDRNAEEVVDDSAWRKDAVDEP